MSLSFDVAKTILHAEEVARLSKPILLEQQAIARNDIYHIADVPLTISHDCQSVDIPTFFKSVNHMRIDSCESPYSYRINHGEWIDVTLESEIVESSFDIETIDIKNDVGTDTLHIYLEGVRSEVRCV